MVKRVLMIAFHFPPQQGSSGIQRTVNFCRYLPRHGWEPIVLTVHPRVYAAVSNQAASALGELVVHRAAAWDAVRHFSLAGVTLPPMAWPDRWASWRLAAVPAGMALIRRLQPSVIWSTFPVATAHWIGLTLARRSGLPWVADFRDVMTEDDYPPGRFQRGLWRALEQRTVARCRAAVFTTPGAAGLYAARYPTLPENRWQVIANGYDEEDFAAAERVAPACEAKQTLVLLHSGVLYPSERDPSAFFDALADLTVRGVLRAPAVRIVLRATGHDDYVRRMIAERQLEALVEIAPAIPYRDALAEMLTVDGLLIFQAANCNRQIPAKLYEYLRARRPILALTDPAGDTASVLRQAGIDAIVRLDARADIASGLMDFLQRIARGTAPIATDEEIASHRRSARTQAVAQLFDSVVGARSSA